MRGREPGAVGAHQDDPLLPFREATRERIVHAIAKIAPALDFEHPVDAARPRP
jgi:hypothetical protein